MKGGIYLTWTDRMKRTIDSFKNMALPLFLYYLLFTLIGVIIAAIAIAIIAIPFFEMADPLNIQSMPYYFDPNIPVPPGYDPFEYGDESDLFGILGSLSYLGPQLMAIIAMGVLVGGLMGALYVAGSFHLTKKAYREKAQFKDIRLKGFLRVVGWYLLVSLISLIAIGIGLLIAFNIESPYAIALFLVVYGLILFAIFVFIAPWTFMAPYYMLNHPQHPFWQTFKASWNFYRSHMGPLWGAFLTVIGISILLELISQSAPNLGLLLMFLTYPFLGILPIVWLLTLEDEDNPPTYTSYESPTPAPFTPYEQTPSSFVNASAGTPDTPDTFSTSQDNQTTSTISNEPPNTSNTTSPPTTPSNTTFTPYTASPSTVDAEPANLYTPPKDPYPIPDYASAPFGVERNSSPDNRDEVQVNFCPTCGKRVRENASYCSQCGTKL
jgi:hypothetical protein